MNHSMLPLPGLSPVRDKTIVAKFDGGLLSSDARILVLREVGQGLRDADRLAACIMHPRAPELIACKRASIIRFRLLLIGPGYEDGNDASLLLRDPIFKLHRDPIFKMTLALPPLGRELCSQSTISRFENEPGARVLLRMCRAMADLYCESFERIPSPPGNLAARPERWAASPNSRDWKWIRRARCLAQRNSQRAK